MAERGKTIICSVLFLDISEYSRKSVSGQISLKERFNAYLSVAIRDVPIDDRIILDTGDGAALSFLGDVGDALQVALSMRESLREGLHMEPPLLVRMGINLGPVRLIRDINGQPNIVGDGINVAQRVMGFADPGQILVSRTYYDAVSRLSPEYAGMFHYQGSRTDKHVREHEIYAIGYPGEFTSTLTLSGENGRSRSESTGMVGKVMSAFGKASPAMKFLYVAMAFVPAVVVGVILVSLLLQRGQQHGGTPPGPVVAPPLAPVSAVSAPVVISGPVVVEMPASAPQSPPPRAHATRPTPQRHPPVRSHTPSDTIFPGGGGGGDGKRAEGQGQITLSCPEGATIYVDGQSKGRMGRDTLTVSADAGKRLVMVMLSSRILYNKSVNVLKNKTVKIGRDVCH